MIGLLGLNLLKIFFLIYFTRNVYGQKGNYIWFMNRFYKKETKLKIDI